METGADERISRLLRPLRACVNAVEPIKPCARRHSAGVLRFSRSWHNGPQSGLAPRRRGRPCKAPSEHAPSSSRILRGRVTLCEVQNAVKSCAPCEKLLAVFNMLLLVVERVEKQTQSQHSRPLSLFACSAKAVGRLAAGSHTSILDWSHVPYASAYVTLGQAVQTLLDNKAKLAPLLPAVCLLFAHFSMWNEVAAFLSALVEVSLHHLSNVIPIFDRMERLSQLDEMLAQRGDRFDDEQQLEALTRYPRNVFHQTWRSVWRALWNQPMRIGPLCLNILVADISSQCYMSLYQHDLLDMFSAPTMHPHSGILMIQVWLLAFLERQILMDPDGGRHADLLVGAKQMYQHVLAGEMMFSFLELAASLYVPQDEILELLRSLERNIPQLAYELAVHLQVNPSREQDFGYFDALARVERSTRPVARKRVTGPGPYVHKSPAFVTDEVMHDSGIDEDIAPIRRSTTLCKPPADDWDELCGPFPPYRSVWGRRRRLCQANVDLLDVDDLVM